MSIICGLGPKVYNEGGNSRVPPWYMSTPNNCTEGFSMPYRALHHSFVVERATAKQEWIKGLKSGVWGAIGPPPPRKEYIAGIVVSVTDKFLMELLAL